MGIADRSPLPVPGDLAKQLGRRGIRKLLTILSDAYHDLYARRWVRADSREDSITEEWFIHVQKRWKPESTFGLIPMQQKSDPEMAKPRGRWPTIDFCFRSEFFQQSYFGAECKLLDEGDPVHLKAYLDNEKGVGRFLSAKYSGNTGAGAMIGYVRKGDSSAVAHYLARGVKQLPGNPKLKKSPPLPKFDQLYQSKHNRLIGVSPFLCFHMLFAFDCPKSDCR